VFGTGLGDEDGRAVGVQHVGGGRRQGLKRFRSYLFCL